MTDFDESKHPRDDDGKFTDKGGGYRQNASYSEILGKDIQLTKQEYARYYEKVGQIKAGLLNAKVANNGQRMIILDNKVIFDNNQFINPRIKYVIEFETEEDLYSFISDRSK